MSGENKEYVLGRGKVFFAAFDEGTTNPGPERYLGNTPELSTSSDQSTLDHYDSDNGINVKDESVTIEDNMTGALVTDNISTENVALAFGASPEPTVIASATGVTESHLAKLGHFIQLGATAATPNGARKVTNVVIKIGTNVVTKANNVDLDLEKGRVYIEKDAPGIEDGDELAFTYDITAQTRDLVVGRGKQARGAMRFISDNPVGPQTDYYWPYVKMTLNGDMNLKGDEWQQIPLQFEVLKKDNLTERVYIERRAS